MRGLWVAALLLLVAPLSGCVGTGGGGGTTPTNASEAGTAPGSSGQETLEAPTWSIGDHWTYTGGGFGETTWVVTGDEGRDWIVHTTNEQVAFLDARTDVSFLGEVRKSDLAGSQGDDRVEYFDWPLEAGKTWTTTWDGVEREITVDRVEDRIAHLTARQEGRLAVEYTYDSAAGHMGSFTFYDENGTETASAELMDGGSNFTGTAVSWTLERVIDRTGTFGVQPTSWGGQFEVPADATDLWLGLTVQCPSGAYDFGFGGNGSGYSDISACPYENAVADPVIEDPGEGTWNYGLTATSPDGEGSYDITLFVRTLEEIPVGDGAGAR